MYVAETNERPRIKIDFSVFVKSEDEKLMVKMHKANIKAENKRLHGSTKWKPQNKLVFTF